MPTKKPTMGNASASPMSANALKGGRYHSQFKDVDREAYLDKKHTGRFIGKKGNAGFAYWNPETQTYVRQSYDDYKKTSWDYRQNNNGDNFLSTYNNAFGNRVRGMAPVGDTFKTYDGFGSTTNVGTNVNNFKFQDEPEGGFGMSYDSSGLTPEEKRKNAIVAEMIKQDPSILKKKLNRDNAIISEMIRKDPSLLFKNGNSPFKLGGNKYTPRYDMKDMGDGTYRGPMGVNKGPITDSPRGNEYRADVVTTENNDREITDEELASFQLNQITAQDSPTMQLARQRGIEQANRRGLMNSSLAAGASMAEMAEAARPIAEANAAAYGDMEKTNQMLESDRRRDDANRESDTFKFNAGEGNDMLNDDRQRTHDEYMKVFSESMATGRQQLASDTAFAIAGIESDNKALISANDSASRIVTGMQTGITEILSNKDISGDEAQTKIQAVIDNANDALAVLGAMNKLDLSALIVG